MYDHKVFHTYGTYHHCDTVVYFRKTERGGIVSVSEWLIPGSWDETALDFRRVYQGGHHDIWCDGKTHVRCEGGFTRASRGTPFKSPRTTSYKCDCAKWADGKNGWAA